jgi:hypothetical protein
VVQEAVEELQLEVIEVVAVEGVLAVLKINQLQANSHQLTNERY